MDYKLKYLKYKAKYLKMQAKMQTGGKPNWLEAFDERFATIKSRLESELDEKVWCFTGSAAIVRLLIAIDTVESNRLLDEMEQPADLDILYQHKKGVYPNYAWLAGFSRVQAMQQKSTTYVDRNLGKIDLIYIGTVEFLLVDGVPVCEPSRMLSTYEESVRDVMPDRIDKVESDKKKVHALKYITEYLAANANPRISKTDASADTSMAGPSTSKRLMF